VGATSVNQADRNQNAIAAVIFLAARWERYRQAKQKPPRGGPEWSSRRIS
jgi:hypothetical protein